MYYYRMARRKYNITRVGKTNRRHDRYRNIKSRNVTRKVQTTQQQINTQQSDFRMKVETIGRIAEQKGIITKRIKNVYGLYCEKIN